MACSPLGCYTWATTWEQYAIGSSSKNSMVRACAGVSCSNCWESRALTGHIADTYYCIVDLHAITMPHEPKDLLEATRR